MKYSKRYIAFTIVLALVFILKFQILGVDNAQVGRFRGGELDTQVWNPMVAKEVNGQTIHAVIDNQTYNNSKRNIPFRVFHILLLKRYIEILHGQKPQYYGSCQHVAGCAELQCTCVR